MTMPETLKPDELVRQLEKGVAQIAMAAATRILSLQADLERVTAERDEVEVECDACVDAAKASWSKHGAMEIAKGQWEARALAAESRATTAKAALVKARTALEQVDAELAEHGFAEIGTLRATTRNAIIALSAGEEENGR